MKAIEWVAVTLALAGLLPTAVWAASSVEFTSVPPHGSFNDLTGRVHGVEFATHRVAVFIHVAGAGWYTKPTCASPLAVIQSNGTWSADITTGGSDQNARQIAAYLVPESFSHPCVLGEPCIPATVEQQAIASTLATRVDPAVRALHWSGYDWWVKNSAGKVGPGPNYFSDSTNNVAVDAAGRLHLRITQAANKWYCAEIVSQRTLGRGQYVFHTETPPDSLDPQVVLGLFTWSDAPADAHREIDIEWARWGDDADTNNAQYVVQPFDQPGHLLRIRTPPGVTNSTHVFDWQTNQVGFTTLAGTNVIAQWTATAGIPASCDENVRLNLWLVQGNAPQNNQEAEVIITRFEHRPPDTDNDGLPDPWERSHGLNFTNALDTATDDDGDVFTNLQEYLAGTDPANPGSDFRVTDIERKNGTVEFIFTTGFRLYAVEYTDSLQSPGPWLVLTNELPGTGAPLQITDPTTGTVTNRFYRIRLLPP